MTLPDNGYRLVSALFLRLLGVIYLVAFVSLGVQIEGLAGSHGIIPAAPWLADLAQHTGIERYFQVPTLFWLNSSDTALTFATTIGALAALLIILNLLTRQALVTAFVLYLSLFQVTQPFLNFQWDTLLLESGFLAIFLTPNSRVLIWLFRWLLFRLRFESGLFKLVSGDPAWSGLTALKTYFEVQPLPNPVAWYFNLLPDWLLRVGTGGTLFVELVVPFMMFLPRRWRFTAAWLTILWQVLILLTSNHNWINFLTIFLCLFLFDDRAVRRVLPQWLHGRLNWTEASIARAPSLDQRLAVGVLSLFILFSSSLKCYELASGKDIPGLTGKVLDYASLYGMVHVYHVFPTMTTQRIELELQGSFDGVTWKTYHFRYKPDELDKRPQFIIPYQPRLDWQMWFVTLHPRHLDWFGRFLEALLSNSREVKALLANDPFPNAAPRFIRVNAYRYEFTNFEERRSTGNWWKRTALGVFTPLPGIEQRSDSPHPAAP
jgi:Lipase maturation factor